MSFLAARWWKLLQNVPESVSFPTVPSNWPRSTAFRRYSWKVNKSSIESFLKISINLKIQKLIMCELIFCLKLLCFEYFGCLLLNKQAKCMLNFINSNDLIIKELLPCDDTYLVFNIERLYRNSSSLCILVWMLAFVVEVIIRCPLVGGLPLIYIGKILKIMYWSK